MNDPSMIPPDQFANLIAQATDEQIAEGMAVNRELLLNEIFGRWPEQFQPERARDLVHRGVGVAAARERPRGRADHALLAHGAGDAPARAPGR